MARTRRLIPFSRVVTNADPGAHLYPALINDTFPLNIPQTAIPDKIRDGDFNTRPARTRLFMSGGALSQFIMREGFPDHERMAVPRKVALSSKPGDMLPVRNPVGNMETAKYSAWGTMLDEYAKGNLK